MGFQARQYQFELVQNILHEWRTRPRNRSNVLAVMPCRSGKCLHPDTPVLTATGSTKRAGDVVAGDKLASPTDGFRTVSGVVTGRQDMYRVTLKKGDPFVCNGDHLLSVIVGGNDRVTLPDGRKVDPGRQPITITARDFTKASKSARAVMRSWVPDNVDFTPTGERLTIPPYILGAWLGDGSVGRPHITKPHCRVVDAWMEYGLSLGLDAKEFKTPGRCSAWHLSLYPEQRGRGKRNPLIELLRDLGVLNSKHVPERYLRASRAERLELLAGLMDTDGSVSKNGFDFISVEKSLSEAVTFLARSVGIRAKLSECEKSIKAVDFTGTYWRVGLSGYASIIPTRDKRPAPYLHRSDPRVCGMVVEPIGDGEYAGFELDGDRLFMLGDFTVTHNTHTFTSLSKNDPNPSCVNVHRQELIGQIAKTHAEQEIPHNIIAPQAVINFCVQKQIKDVGRSYYDPKAPATVAGVDTLIRRFEATDRWCKTVGRVTTDEAHHVQQANKWGTGMSLFENALGLGVTATPIRGDGKSLHRDQGGLFDVLVQGVEMRDLIDGEYKGAVCDYRVIAPASSIDEAELNIGTTGDFTDKSVRKAAHKSEIVGDTVQTYLQHTPGKQAIAFTVDVEQAEQLAEKFRQAGIRAMALDGTTPDGIRQDAMDKFQRGEIQVLTNCDLFSEGLDLPGVDVVMMCRPTMSFGMFVQQFCRCLTPDPANGKRFGIIIDQVGNVLRMAAKYGMPDTPRKWSLWREQGQRKKKEPDAIPHRACECCTMTYPALQMVCPFCGHAYVPDDRGQPKAVDGILTEMSPELLKQLRMQMAQIDSAPAVPYGATPGMVDGIQARHHRQMAAQAALKEAMEFYGGVMLANGNSDTQMQARFYHRFGVDVLTAQGLKAKEAIALRDEIRKSLS